MLEPGRTLKEWIRRVRAVCQALPLELAVVGATQVGRAAAF
jgi:hypothetical protein